MDKIQFPNDGNEDQALGCGACGDGCPGKQCQVEADSPPIAAAPQVVADERALSGEDITRMAYEKFGIVADDMEIVSFVAEVRRLDGLSAVPVQAQEPRKPTDLSNRLRSYIDQNLMPYPSDVLAAADEIERYYGGMMNWKAAAEAKDHAPAQPVAVPDGWQEKMRGLIVSMDVSTGDDDASHRIFGEVEGVMPQGDSYVILAVESSRNFAAPAAQGDAIEGELTKIVKSGAEKDFPGFLEWIADRLVYVHNENNNVDYVQTLRTRAKQLRAAIAAKAAS